MLGFLQNFSELFLDSGCPFFLSLSRWSHTASVMFRSVEASPWLPKFYQLSHISGIFRFYLNKDLINMDCHYNLAKTTNGTVASDVCTVLYVSERVCPFACACFWYRNCLSLVLPENGLKTTITTQHCSDVENAVMCSFVLTVTH